MRSHPATESDTAHPVSDRAAPEDVAAHHGGTAHSDKPNTRGGAVHIPRSRGAVSGVALIILGAWAAIIPFIGPLFSYGYTPNTAWTWTAARGWLEVLPGVVALVAGVALLVSANRVTASVAGWFGVAAGVWLVIGRDLAAWLHLGNPGVPASLHPSLRSLEAIGLFSGVGAAIAVIAAVAVGRLSIRSVRDMRVAQRHERRDEKRRSKISDAAYEAGRRDEARREHDVPAGGVVTEERAGEHGALRERVRHLTHHDPAHETAHEEVHGTVHESAPGSVRGTTARESAPDTRGEAPVTDPASPSRTIRD